MNEVEVIKIVRNHVEQLPVRNNIVHQQSWNGNIDVMAAVAMGQKGIVPPGNQRGSTVGGYPKKNRPAGIETEIAG